MKRFAAVSALAVVSLAQVLSGAQPVLANGVVSYTGADGKQRGVSVPWRCSDLWVSPDGSVIAFIAVEKSDPPTAPDQDPFIEQSSVFVARKADGFKPVRFASTPILIDGRQWRVVRSPSVSADLRTVYFSVPFTMTSWKLVSVPFTGGPYAVIADQSSYCVIWGGAHSGEILMESRGYNARGVTYGFYLRDRSGAQVSLPDDPQHPGFDDFAVWWSREHAGACSPAP